MKMDSISFYIPAIIIFAAAIYTAREAHKKNNDRLNYQEQSIEKQKTIDIIGKNNTELNERIIKQNQIISDITSDVKNISKENSTLSKENIIISETIKKISDKIHDVSIKSLDNSEAERFFRELNFSILNKFFPKGCDIIRQNFSGKSFSNSTSNDAIIFENIKSYIEVDGKFASLVMVQNSKNPVTGNSISNVTLSSPISLDENHFLKPQKLQGHRIRTSSGDLCQFAVIISVDDLGYTFAVGRSLCKRN